MFNLKTKYLCLFVCFGNCPNFQMVILDFIFIFFQYTYLKREWCNGDGWWNSGHELYGQWLSNRHIMT